jgi:hypothetical protein
VSVLSKNTCRCVDLEVSLNVAISQAESKLQIILRLSYRSTTFDFTEREHTLKYRGTNLTPDHSHVLKCIWAPFLCNCVRKNISGQVCLFVCLFPWASAASHGCTAACWLIVPPALNVPTLTTRCPRAYRRVPHSSGGSWNLWAGIRTDNFWLNADFHGTFRVLLHAANMRHGTHGFTSLPKEGVLKNPTASAGFEPANLGTRGQHANLDHRSRLADKLV